MKNALVVFGSLVTLGFALSACEEKIVQPLVIALKPQGNAGASSAGGAAACASASATAMTRVVPPPTCEGRCCPTAAECYPRGNPSPYSGAECLAKRDNTTETRWQLRQTLSVSQKPLGLSSAIQALLVRRTELMNSMCGAPNGSSGFIQLVDFDTAAKTSRTGFARFVPDEATALAGGLCFGAIDAYSSPGYTLPTLYPPPAGWPKGLPAPMPAPWKVAPVTAVELDQDFTLPADRETLLARLDAGGDLYGKGTGVFYYDRTTGYMHGYSPLTYILNYNAANDYVAIPIRESELTQRMNDPLHPNCAGVLLGANGALPQSCMGDSTSLAWGCPAGDCAADELAPTKIEGYFLIAELEQIFTLGQTLCNLFAGGSYPNWVIPDDDKSCRKDPKWNPMDSVNGLPAGDWCATTNSPASPACHDAWQSVSFSTFQAFPIADGTCPTL